MRPRAPGELIGRGVRHGSVPMAEHRQGHRDQDQRARHDRRERACAGDRRRGAGQQRLAGLVGDLRDIGAEQCQD